MTSAQPEPSDIDVRLDHTIIPAHDKHTSAEFFARVFGLPAPTQAGHFMQVRLSDGRLLDFADAGGEIAGHHYAFLVNDATFDHVLSILKEWRIDYWADPRGSRPGEINTNHGGRGVYFQDPAGHYLEALTARYDGTELT